MAKRPPPPEWTDLPGEINDAPETITGVHRVVKHDLGIMKLVQAVTVVVALLAAIFGGYRALASDAKDAGVAAAAEAMREAKAAQQANEATQRELVRYQAESSNRFDRLEQASNRGDKKLDALINAQGIWNPAPTPRDGGR